MTGDTIAAEPPGADAGMPAGRRARLIWTLSHALLLLDAFNRRRCRL